MNDNFPTEAQSGASSLHSMSSVVLATLTGLLIVLPLAGSGDPTSGVGLGLIGGLAGFMVGYRRRHSRAFFYFSLVCVLVLAVVVSFNSQGTP